MSSLKTLLAALIAIVASTASAQPFPAGPVRLVIPFGAGSISDVYARLAGRHLGDALGQPVIVEPRPGANGSIAAVQVAKSPPDGRTLFLTTNTTHAANPSLMKQMTYDPVRDFAPITRMGNTAFYMAVAANASWRSVQDVIAAAKAEPGKISYGSGNSSGIVAGAALQKLSGTQMTHVPYKSSPQALTDVVGGQISFMFADLSVSRPHLQAGRVRLLAVAAAQRSSLASDIPTLAEAGFPGVDILAWFGLFAPAGTPAAIIDRLNTEISKVLARADVRDTLATMGIEAVTSTPAELGAWVEAEIRKWAKMVADAGIQPE